MAKARAAKKAAVTAKGRGRPSTSRKTAKAPAPKVTAAKKTVTKKTVKTTAKPPSKKTAVVSDVIATTGKPGRPPAQPKIPVGKIKLELAASIKAAERSIAKLKKLASQI